MKEKYLMLPPHLNKPVHYVGHIVYKGNILEFVFYKSRSLNVYFVYDNKKDIWDKWEYLDFEDWVRQNMDDFPFFNGDCVLKKIFKKAGIVIPVI